MNFGVCNGGFHYICIYTLNFVDPIGLDPKKCCQDPFIIINVYLQQKLTTDTSYV